MCYYKFYNFLILSNKKKETNIGFPRFNSEMFVIVMIS